MAGTINVGNRQVPARCFPREVGITTSSPHEFRYDAHAAYYCVYCLLNVEDVFEAAAFSLAVNPVQTELHP